MPGARPRLQIGMNQPLEGERRLVQHAHLVLDQQAPEGFR